MKNLLVLLLLLYAVPALAVTYEWTDDSGTVNFTEDLGRVPKKFRKRAKVLGGDESGAAQVIEEPAAKSREPSPPRETTGPKDKKLYGGKDEKTWRSELGSAKNELQVAERELAALQDRLKDTSKMTRTEYLSIQTSIKHGEIRVQDLRKRLEQLRQSAEKAEVPL